MKLDINLVSDPPYSLEAERAIIASCLLDPDNIAQVSETLKPEDFYDRLNRDIFEAMIKLYLEGKPIDIPNIVDRLPPERKRELSSVDGGPAGVISTILESVALLSSVDSYIEVVKRHSIRRALMRIGMEMIQLAHTESDINALLDRAEMMLYELSSDRFTGNFYPIDMIADQLFKRIEILVRERRDIIGIPSYLQALDSMTSGFQAGDLIIVAGRPGMGKTSFALNIALNVARNMRLPVLIFSLEMSKEQIAQRILSLLANVPLQHLRTGRLNERELVRLTQALRTLKTIPIYIDDTSNITALEIRSKARRLKLQRKQLGLIVIDYIQLILPTGRRESRSQELSEISRSLKALAKELEVPLIVLSQLSREVERRIDKRPMLSDLRESGAIEQEADLVLFLYREDYYVKDAKEPGLTELIIAKQRNGPTGVKYVTFKMDTMKFMDYVGGD